MRFLACLILASSLASPASAQEATAEMLDAEARARFELALVHVQNGRFAEAAREFHQAWEVSHRDELLYNESLAWRDGGFPREAATALAAFIDSLDEHAPDRVNLTARLRTLEQQADALEAAAAAEGEPDDPADPAEPASDDVASDGGGAPHPVSFVLIGGGAAIAIAGAVLGGVALSISDSLAAECAGGVCPESRRGDVDDGPGFALAADILLPVGAVTALVGVILAITVTASDDAPSAALACDGAGCVGAVRGAF